MSAEEPVSSARRSLRPHLIPASRGCSPGGGRWWGGVVEEVAMMVMEIRVAMLLVSLSVSRTHLPSLKFHLIFPLSSPST